MAAEHTTTLTPSEYISHHLTFLNHPVGQGSFWSFNLDTIAVSIIVGFVGPRILLLDRPGRDHRRADKAPGLRRDVSSTSSTAR